jgi:hypothetical protein
VGLAPEPLPGETAPVPDDLLASQNEDGGEVIEQQEIVVAEPQPRKRKKKYLLDYLFGEDEPAQGEGIY